MVFAGLLPTAVSVDGISETFLRLTVSATVAVAVGGSEKRREVLNQQRHFEVD